MDKQAKLVTCDLGGTKLLVRICSDTECVDHRYLTGGEFSPQDLAVILGALEKRFNLDDYPLAIAFPGLLNGNECYISNVLPEFNGFDLSQLTQRGHLQLALNDVEAGTYGIVSNQSKVEILVMAGTGIGMGIAIDGQVFRGESGYGGELGSCRIPDSGSYPRLTQIASGKALKENSDFSQAQCGKELGLAASWIVNCFNPGRIVFAGGLFNEEDYQQACFDAIAEFSLAQSFEHCQLVIEPEMHSIVVRGLEKAVEQKLEKDSLLI